MRGRLVQDLRGFIGLDSTTARAWNRARWPGALAAAMRVFAFAYCVTPDVQQRSFRWVTPGTAVGVLLWLLASASTRLQRSGRRAEAFGTRVRA